VSNEFIHEGIIVNIIIQNIVLKKQNCSCVSEKKVDLVYMFGLNRSLRLFDSAKCFDVGIQYRVVFTYR